MKNKTDLINKIIAYTDYLISDEKLNITLHLPKNFYFGNEYLKPLKKYNNHSNPYCFYIKNIEKNFENCIEYQYRLMKKCENQEFLIETCPYGVKQFVFGIKLKNECGFLSVSGYKDEKFEYNEKYGQFLQEKTEKTEKLKIIIFPLVLMLENYFEDYKESIDPFEKIKNALDINYNLTLEELSLQLGYSKSLISHLFKTKANMTIKSYCNILKIKDAETMLKNKEISITDVAFSSGFNNFSYFINVFKAMKGVTPLKWRKEYFKNKVKHKSY